MTRPSEEQSQAAATTEALGYLEMMGQRVFCSGSVLSQLLQHTEILERVDEAVLRRLELEARELAERIRSIRADEFFEIWSLIE